MKTILLVNDEINVTPTLREFLSRRGYDVFTAAVRDAAKRVKKVRPSHVILGLFMDKNGVVSFLKAIRKFDPRIIVIIIAWYPDLETAKEAFRLGAYDFLVTPIKLKHIENIIKQSCSKPAVSVEKLCNQGGEL